MTLPTLTPCPKPDCQVQVAHWRASGGEPYEHITLDVADVEALLDMVGGDPR